VDVRGGERVGTGIPGCSDLGHGAQKHHAVLGAAVGGKVQDEHEKLISATQCFQQLLDIRGITQIPGTLAGSRYPYASSTKAPFKKTHTSVNKITPRHALLRLYVVQRLL